VTLTDYKVRVLETDAGTAAAVRVWIQSTGPDGETWMTVGSSTNVIQASWFALADSLEYALVTSGTNRERVHHRGTEGTERTSVIGASSGL
jgi:2-isopropylmalate synthase